VRSAQDRDVKAHSPARVKNLMHRAFNDLLDPPPSVAEQKRVRAHFGDRCAYCDAPAEPRDGHLDHADAAGGNGIGNLILACKRCNGDEKREMNWDQFVMLKSAGDAEAYVRRHARIAAWMAAHPTRVRPPAALVDLQAAAEAEAKAAFDSAFARVRDAAKAWRVRGTDSS
jgi:hypothetical protein